MTAQSRSDAGTDDYDVLIVGAGPVGLSLATELGLRGVSALLIEQNARTGRQPRAKTTNVRSMEHMRRWGVAEKIRAASPLPADYPTDIAFKTRLFGRRLAGFENAFYASPTPRNDFFSEAAQWIPQHKVEAVLRDHARSLPGIEIGFGCRLDALEETADGVTATLLDVETGARRTVRTRYVAGADGARSVVRGLIGAEMQGRHAMAQFVSLILHAPAAREIMEHEPAIMYWLVNPDTPGVASPMDEDDVWMFGFAIGPGQKVDADDALARVDAAFGRPIDAKLLATDLWSAHSLIATHYATTRVFLIGDACHLHPPFGGYGMNLGIADAVDLGWKLAATLQGWGGPALLASYEQERRPVHRRVIDEAVANHAVLPQHLLTAELEADGTVGETARQQLGERIRAEKIREFRTLGVVLGYNYSGSPITVPDGSAPPAEHYRDYSPSAHPGCLAPHLWLGENRSLYDLFGPGFTLLVTAEGVGNDIDALLAAAHERKMPLTLVEPSVAPEQGDLSRLYGARLALIRPDQHVAWRGDTVGGHAGAILDQVRGASRAVA